ncbi:MAG: hypothetical protein ACREL7_12290, partial [Longimicrobiales bacterium]
MIVRLFAFARRDAHRLHALRAANLSFRLWSISSRSGLVGGAALPLLIMGCGDPRADGEATARNTESVPMAWTVEGQPQLEIGEADGDERYLFHEITSVVRLPNGNIAVLNAGSGEIRLYDAQGGHVRTTGGTGSGPGEYRMPARIYLTHPDSLLVFDADTRMETVLDTAARFQRSVRYEVAEDETFTRDVWLYGRMLVDGPMLPGDRPALRPALDRLPPVAVDSFRFVRLDPFGRFWTRIEPHNSDRRSEWQVYDSEGDILANVQLPARFELLDIGTDYLAGRARDRMNVERVRIYSYQAPSHWTRKEITNPPARPAANAMASAAMSANTPAAMIEDVRTEMQALLRHAA